MKSSIRLREQLTVSQARKVLHRNLKEIKSTNRLLHEMTGSIHYTQGARRWASEELHKNNATIANYYKELFKSDRKIFSLCLRNGALYPHDITAV